MSLAAIAPVLAASADLALVRLIRGAIAEPIDYERSAAPTTSRTSPYRPGEAGGVSSITKTSCACPAEPADIVKVDVASETTPEPEPVGPTTTPAMGPLPAPWQLLLREQVWNRPVEAPPALTVKHVHAYPSGPVAARGQLIDAFL